MLNKTIILLAAILLLTNCFTQKKVIKLFEEGYTKQHSFKSEIPFEYRLGLVIIKVEINNETYDFVIDTGATNVLSKELAETLDSKGLLTVNNRDGQGNSKPMEFTKIEALTIGGVKFEKTASGIGDFNQSIEVGCLEIDGIIGANLMKLAVWKIDYRNQIITITNTKESLSLGAKTQRIPFYADIVYQPYCNVKINGVEEKNVKIDLGSNGGFSLSYHTYEKMQQEVMNNKKALEYGYEGGTYYGYGKLDSVYYLQGKELLIGDIRLNNQILKVSKSLSSTIGTAFFKNYDLVLDWEDNELVLSPHTDYDKKKFIHRGFKLGYQEDALRIASLFKGSEAEKVGIQLDDKILQINGKDYSNTSIEDYCDLIKKMINKDTQVSNLVINRNGEPLSFDLKNNVIIE